MAAALLLHLHGEVLREAAARTGRHYEGLGQLSRSVPGLTSRLRRRLCQLDAAAALIRHVTKPLCEQFLLDVLTELKPLQRDEAENHLKVEGKLGSCQGLANPKTSLGLGKDQQPGGQPLLRSPPLRPPAASKRAEAWGAPKLQPGAAPRPPLQRQRLPPLQQPAPQPAQPPPPAPPLPAQPATPDEAQRVAASRPKPEASVGPSPAATPTPTPQPEATFKRGLLWPGLGQRPMTAAQREYTLGRLAPDWLGGREAMAVPAASRYTARGLARLARDRNPEGTRWLDNFLWLQTRVRASRPTGACG